MPARTQPEFPRPMTEEQRLAALDQLVQRLCIEKNWTHRLGYLLDWSNEFGGSVHAGEQGVYATDEMIDALRWTRQKALDKKGNK